MHLFLSIFVVENCAENLKDTLVRTTQFNIPLTPTQVLW